jgi:hypothetical protein
MGRPRIFLVSSILGFVGGVLATAVLWLVFGPDSFDSELFIGPPEVTYTFPYVGGLLAGVWATILASRSFGPLRGAQSAALAFVSFNVILALFNLVPFYSGGELASALFWVVWSHTLTGFVLFGWALVAIGAFGGWIIQRHEWGRSNPLLNTDAREERPRAG